MVSGQEARDSEAHDEQRGHVPAEQAEPDAHPHPPGPSGEELLGGHEDQQTGERLEVEVLGHGPPGHLIHRHHDHHARERHRPPAGRQAPGLEQSGRPQGDDDSCGTQGQGLDPDEGDGARGDPRQHRERPHDELEVRGEVAPVLEGALWVEITATDERERLGEDPEVHGFHEPAVEQRAEAEKARGLDAQHANGHLSHLSPRHRPSLADHGGGHEARGCNTLTGGPTGGPWQRW